MAQAQPPKEAAPIFSPGEKTHVILRPYPKVVYLYLTWLASLVCGVLHPEASVTDVDGALALNADQVQTGYLLGRIWLAIFSVNILVISFEFSRIRSVAIAFFVIAFVFAGIQMGFLDVLGHFFGGLQLLMNKVFYYVIAALFSIIYLIVFIASRFNYWEIQPNEILHHHGFLGDVQRYPTQRLKMKKEITDVLEHLLLRAGTLVLDPEGEERPIILENIINLNRVEDKIQRLLGTLKVRIDQGQVGGTD